ncbi:hypothetical protein ACJJTC_001065 [Scirpophaga incertulas]
MSNNEQSKIITHGPDGNGLLSERGEVGCMLDTPARLDVRSQNWYLPARSRARLANWSDSGEPSPGRRPPPALQPTAHGARVLVYVECSAGFTFNRFVSLSVKGWR